MDLVDILETMEVGFVNLSVNDFSHLDTNQTMEFTLAKLQENQWIIGKRLHEQLIKKFDKRRNPLFPILHKLWQSSHSSVAYPMDNDIMKDLQVCHFLSAETMGTDLNLH